MKTVIIIITLIFIAACTTTHHLQTTDDELAVARQRIPGITLTDLEAGNKIYTTNCSGCHHLHRPGEYNAVQWKNILQEMFKKAKMTDETQKQLVRNFLVAKSK